MPTFNSFSSNQSNLVVKVPTDSDNVLQSIKYNTALQAMKGKASVRGHHLIKQKRKISFFKKKKKSDYFYINNPSDGNEN